MLSLVDCVDHKIQNFFILMAAKSKQSSDSGWSTVNTSREVGNIIIHNEQNDAKIKECFKEETKIIIIYKSVIHKSWYI